GRSTRSTRSLSAPLSEKTPVALLTGFLGSGKTTLLQRLLSHPDMGETAVIVNELGEVAIDHHLLRRVDERTVVLGNGCVCCSLRGLGRRLAALNPTATIVEASFGELEPKTLFGGEDRHLRAVPSAGAEHPEHDGVQAHSLVFEEQLDWIAFGVWLTMLLASRGGDVLRVKGLLDVGGPGPVLLNGVQHVVHPPQHLDAWPDGDRRSRIVFIGRGLERHALERSLAAFTQ